MDGTIASGLAASLARRWWVAPVLAAMAVILFPRQRAKIPNKPAGFAQAADPKEPPAGLQDLWLEREVTAVLAGLGRLAAERFTILQMAVAPDIVVRADRAALRGALSLAVRSAVERAEGGHVLVSASRHAGRVRLAITDDGPPVPRELQESALREAHEILALQGSSLEVEVHPGRGSTTAIRLAGQASPSGQEAAANPPLAELATAPS